LSATWRAAVSTVRTPTTTFVGHRHVPSAANQHTSWRSLIRCCWTSRVEQSANTAARVLQNTLLQFRRALKTHLFGRW